MRAEIDLSNGGGALKRLADIFYPNRCPFCDSFIPYDRLCCTECFDSVLWTDEYICPKCGKYMVEKRNSRGEILHLCSNENCRYRSDAIVQQEEDNDE